MLANSAWEDSEVAKILIVDDRPANLTALEAVLEPLGHQVLRATSGSEALRVLLNQDVAVILMDVQMPGMDGMETASLIKQRDRCRHIPIVFLSAISAESTTIFKGYASGAVDYLLKPFDPEILRSKVSVFADLFRQGEMIKKQAKLLRERERETLERKSELRFRSLTDSMPQCVWAARNDGRVYYCNKAWTAYVGVSQDGDEPKSTREGREELASDGAEVPFISVIHPEDRETAASVWSKAIASGQPFEVQGRLRRHRDGGYRWHLARGVPERDERGQIVGWITTATDIDDQKHAEAREHEARKEAERANRLKDEFLATVSHELRTPLNAIIGWTQILRSGKLDSVRADRALETISRNANLQIQLVQDILDVSRIIAGKFRIRLDLMDPISVVQAAVEVVRPSAEAKGIELAAVIEASARMKGDPDRLQQVFSNLLHNAVKFTPKGGRVEISTTNVEGRLKIAVSDTGEGISPEFLPRVFDRFSQEDSSMTRKHGGLGLGLSIVHHLVSLHGGSVHAESEGVGRGATFIVELPSLPELPASFAEERVATDADAST